MNRQTLKQWFSRGKKPTETQFAELIDSFWHKQDDDLTINDIINLAKELSEKASKTELATAQADADVVYKAVIRQATVVNLSDGETEYTAPAVGAYLVVDETENAGGIFTVDKTGNSGNQEKILVQLPADNSKPTAIKLIGASGNIVHWKDYAPGTLIKVWWFEGDSFEIDGEGSLPTISDQRLKGDILDYDVANETAVLKFLDSLDVQIDGETAMQLGQWGVRFSNFLELMKHGVATIWNGMGQMILHATNTGTHLFFEGKKILSADQRATALQQHRRVPCHTATDITDTLTVGETITDYSIRRGFGTDSVLTGYIEATTDGNTLTPIYPYSIYGTTVSANYRYYRLSSVKDNSYIESNTVVAGGTDSYDLKQFTTLNLGDGWLLCAGIGEPGFDINEEQPKLPYGYANKDWYLKLYDPMKRLIYSSSKNGDTEIYDKGVKITTIKNGMIMKDPAIEVWDCALASIDANAGSIRFYNRNQRVYIQKANVSEINTIGSISCTYGALNGEARLYKVEVYATLENICDYDLILGIGLTQPGFQAGFQIYGGAGTIKAGDRYVQFSQYLRGSYGMFFSASGLPTSYQGTTVRFSKFIVIVTKL